MSVTSQPVSTEVRDSLKVKITKSKTGKYASEINTDKDLHKMSAETEFVVPKPHKKRAISHKPKTSMEDVIKKLRDGPVKAGSNTVDQPLVGKMAPAALIPPYQPPTPTPAVPHPGQNFLPKEHVVLSRTAISDPEIISHAVVKQTAHDNSSLTQVYHVAQPPDGSTGNPEFVGLTHKLGTVNVVEPLVFSKPPPIVTFYRQNPPKAASHTLLSNGEASANIPPDKVVSNIDASKHRTDSEVSKEADKEPCDLKISEVFSLAVGPLKHSYRQLELLENISEDTDYDSEVLDLSLPERTRAKVAPINLSSHKKSVFRSKAPVGTIENTMEAVLATNPDKEHAKFGNLIGNKIKPAAIKFRPAAQTEKHNIITESSTERDKGKNEPVAKNVTSATAHNVSGPSAIAYHYLPVSHVMQGNTASFHLQTFPGPPCYVHSTPSVKPISVQTSINSTTRVQNNTVPTASSESQHGPSLDQSKTSNVQKMSKAETIRAILNSSPLCAYSTIMEKASENINKAKSVIQARKAQIKSKPSLKVGKRAKAKSYVPKPVSKVFKSTAKNKKAENGGTCTNLESLKLIKGESSKKCVVMPVSKTNLDNPAPSTSYDSNDLSDTESLPETIPYSDVDYQTYVYGSKTKHNTISTSGKPPANEKKLSKSCTKDDMMSGLLMLSTVATKLNEQENNKYAAGKPTTARRRRTKSKQKQQSEKTAEEKSRDGIVNDHKYACPKKSILGQVQFVKPLGAPRRRKPETKTKKIENSGRPENPLVNTARTTCHKEKWNSEKLRVSNNLFLPKKKDVEIKSPNNAGGQNIEIQEVKKEAEGNAAQETAEIKEMKEEVWTVKKKRKQKNKESSMVKSKKKLGKSLNAENKISDQDVSKNDGNNNEREITKPAIDEESFVMKNVPHEVEVPKTSVENIGSSEEISSSGKLTTLEIDTNGDGESDYVLIDSVNANSPEAANNDKVNNNLENVTFTNDAKVNTVKLDPPAPSSIEVKMQKKRKEKVTKKNWLYSEINKNRILKVQLTRLLEEDLVSLKKRKGFPVGSEGGGRNLFDSFKVEENGSDICTSPLKISKFSNQIGTMMQQFNISAVRQKYQYVFGASDVQQKRQHSVYYSTPCEAAKLRRQKHCQKLSTSVKEPRETELLIDKDSEEPKVTHNGTSRRELKITHSGTSRQGQHVAAIKQGYQKKRGRKLQTSKPKPRNKKKKMLKQSKPRKPRKSKFSGIRMKNIMKKYKQSYSFVSVGDRVKLRNRNPTKVKSDKRKYNRKEDSHLQKKNDGEIMVDLTGLSTLSIPAHKVEHGVKAHNLDLSISKNKNKKIVNCKNCEMPFEKEVANMDKMPKLLIRLENNSEMLKEKFKQCKENLEVFTEPKNDMAKENFELITESPNDKDVGNYTLKTPTTVSPKMLLDFKISSAIKIVDEDTTPVIFVEDDHIEVCEKETKVEQGKKILKSEEVIDLSISEDENKEDVNENKEGVNNSENNDHSSVIQSKLQTSKTDYQTRKLSTSETTIQTSKMQSSSPQMEKIFKEAADKASEAPLSDDIPKADGDSDDTNSVVSLRFTRRMKRDSLGPAKRTRSISHSSPSQKFYKKETLVKKTYPKQKTLHSPLRRQLNLSTVKKVLQFKSRKCSPIKYAWEKNSTSGDSEKEIIGEAETQKIKKKLSQISYVPPKKANISGKRTKKQKLDENCEFDIKRRKVDQNYDKVKNRKKAETTEGVSTRKPGNESVTYEHGKPECNHLDTKSSKNTAVADRVKVKTHKSKRLGRLVRKSMEELIGTPLEKEPSKAGTDVKGTPEKKKPVGVRAIRGIHVYKSLLLRLRQECPVPLKTFTIPLKK